MHGHNHGRDQSGKPSTRLGSSTELCSGAPEPRFSMTEPGVELDTCHITPPIRRPLPEQEDQRQARSKQLRASFDHVGDNACPFFLKALSCNHTVLNCKDARQHRIDDQRL